MNLAPPSVLQVRSSAGLYGADRMVLTLNRALAAQGVRSRLLSINNYRMREQALHEAAMTQAQDAALLPCEGRLDLRTARALAGQVERLPQPIIHVHDYKSAFYAWLATRRRRVPLVATLHGWVENSQSQRLYHRIEMALLKKFDALVVVAGAQAERLAQAGIPRSRIHQVDNAIEPPPAVTDMSPVLRANLGLAPDGYVFGAIGRLSPEKNIGLLLEAFASLAETDHAASLLVVGDGAEREALQARAVELGLGKRAIFTGVRDDMERIYPLIDCLVLPSLTEGMPRFGSRPRESAIPSTPTPVGEWPRLPAHGPRSRQGPVGDLGALATAMRDAAAEPGARDEAARDYVASRHFPAAMANAYLAIYHSLLANEHGRKAS